MYVIKSNRKTNSYTVRKINRVTQVVRVGRRGLQGETGPQGPKGDQGDPATNLVQSVNGKQGVVVLNATDVGADPTGSASQALQDAKDYTDSEVSTLDSSLATVAKTGSYNDLSNKPTIPSIAGLATEAQVQDVQDNLDAHEADTANPHGVTKAQVGLGNVDNTSDANKPVSTATQTALNAKANASDTVNLTGNQTVAGVKTFSSSPVVPTATTDTQAVNKAQMDAADALKVNKSGDAMTGRLGNSTSNLASSNTRGGKEILYGATSIGNFGALNNTDGIEFFNALSNGTGITLGASNATAILKGTGFPNGVITAPVGSTYIDTNATNGAIEWKKATGTGNTGWVVSVGDTGWRAISTWGTDGVVVGAALPANTSPTSGAAGGIYVQRTNSTVHWRIIGLTYTGLATHTIATGFNAGGRWGKIPILGADNSLSFADAGGSMYIGRGGLVAGPTYGFLIDYETTLSWPTILPGTAV